MSVLFNHFAFDVAELLFQFCDSPFRIRSGIMCECGPGPKNTKTIGRGTGSPAVKFEGGFGAGIAAWSTVQKEVAGFAQTVSYDRAGLGQSELVSKPRPAKQIANELHTALQKAQVKLPYVLVGPSLGGMFVRVFADLYPDEVMGIVLIDPS